MGSATNRATGTTEKHQHRADDQHDEADSPQNGDSENETEEQENKSENNHAVQVPLADGLQTGTRTLPC